MRFAGSTDFSQLMAMPDFSTMSATNLQGRGMVNNANDSAIGASKLAGIGAAAGVRSANYKADAIKAQGQAQGQQAMASGLGSMFSGIAGGIGSMGSNSMFSYAGGPGSSGTALGAGGGNVGGYGTFGPNYGIYQG